MKNKFKHFIMWIFDFKTLELWHPESPGIKITVNRSRFGRLFKPKDFATLQEAIKSKNI